MMNKRPTKQSKEVLQPAMKELFEKHIKQLDDYGDDQECIENLVRNYNDDAYEFAKGLESDGWWVDFQLCEALDAGSIYVHSHLSKLQEEWAKSTPITLFKLGNEVIVNRPFSSVKGKQCIITDVKEKTAQYAVVEKEKYVPGKFGGYVIDHEDLQLVNG